MTFTSAIPRTLFLACSGITLFLVTYAVARTPTRVASRLGTRGLMRRRALARSSRWAAVEPLVRWLGVRVSPLVSDALHLRIDKQIMLAGDFLGLTPEEYVALSILGSAFGFVTGVAISNAWNVDLGLCILLGTMFGAAGPYLHISEEVNQRQLKINRGLPYAVDLMALAMSAGLDFVGAVREVVEKSSDPDDPLTFELTLILQELNLGKTRKAALQEFAARCPSTPVREFVGAVIQAEERGNPVAHVLQIQASVSRSRRTAMGEETAAKAGVKMIGPVGLLTLCVLILIAAPMGMRIMDEFTNNFAKGGIR